MPDLQKTRVLAIALLLSGTSVVEAGRPLTIDDADPVEPGLFEFEAGVAVEEDSASRHWDFPLGLTYGLVENIEIGFAFGGQLHREETLSGTDHDHGIDDLEIGVKWRFLESCPMGARHALVPSVKMPTASRSKGLGSGETDYDLTWVVSWSLADKTGIHYNLGHSWIGGTDKNAIHYGVALDYLLLDSIQWVGEAYAENEATGRPDPDAACNTGLRWMPSEVLTLDAAVGTKLRGDAPDLIATAGLTYLFGVQ